MYVVCMWPGVVMICRSYSSSNIVVGRACYTFECNAMYPECLCCMFFFNLKPAVPNLGEKIKDSTLINLTFLASFFFCMHCSLKPLFQHERLDVMTL